RRAALYPYATLFRSEHPYGIADRATPDRYIATFEAFAQRSCTDLIIYETDDSIARCERRSFFRRTDHCHVNAHHCFSGRLTPSRSEEHTSELQSRVD